GFEFVCKQHRSPRSFGLLSLHTQARATFVKTFFWRINLVHRSRWALVPTLLATDYGALRAREVAGRAPVIDMLVTPPHDCSGATV
ncbi:MAG: hypothetical protein D6694_14690, partial [Gammaproteobacteria bacterium]